MLCSVCLLMSPKSLFTQKARTDKQGSRHPSCHPSFRAPPSTPHTVEYRDSCTAPPCFNDMNCTRRVGLSPDLLHLAYPPHNILRLPSIDVCQHCTRFVASANALMLATYPSEDDGGMDRCVATVSYKLNSTLYEQFSVGSIIVLSYALDCEPA